MRLQFDNIWIPYTLSMFPPLYQIDGHRHWVSDLVAGAAIGTFVGTVVFENYHRTTDREGGAGAGSEETFQLNRPSWWDGVKSRVSWGITPYYGRLAASVRVGF